MIYIALTIFVNGLIYVILRLFTNYKIDTFQAIVVNYFTSALLGVLLTGASQVQGEFAEAKGILPYALVLGILFISVFTCIGKSSQIFGVSTTSIADKLSLIFPVLFAFFVYSEPVTALKIMGIILSMVSIVFAVLGKKPNTNIISQSVLFYPFIVFVGGGIISILINEVQLRFSTINYSTFLIGLFGVAFSIGFVILLSQIIQKKSQFTAKNIIAGIGLGIPNFFSIYFLMLALNSGQESSIVFPIVNIGIVVFATIAGLLLFKEQLKPINYFGVLLAIIAIALFLID